MIGTISIHAPRAGSDSLEGLQNQIGDLFQSTLPVRGATYRRRYKSRYRDISIHAPRAGSDVDRVPRDNYDVFISIHAPRAGSDARVLAQMEAEEQFQSTLPVRGATRWFRTLLFRW